MYCGLDEKDKGPNIGGIDIFIDSNIRRSLMELKAISNIIITGPAPTEEADIIVMQDFYDQLHTV
jgi:hypothetical protein